MGSGGGVRGWGQGGRSVDGIGGWCRRVRVRVVGVVWA